MSQAETTRIDAIFRRFRERDPAPVTELIYMTPFSLLVAVVLSAQATDVSVNKATPALFARAADPAAMVALGEARVRDAIKTIGLYNMKAKNVVALSERLLLDHAGEVPRDRAALEALPGVGTKTAAVVMNALWGEPTIAVDTHVFRVSNRLPLAVGKTADAVEAGLMQVVPDAFKSYAHHWLILHGRYTCTARRPACPTCLVRDLCLWPDKTVAAPQRGVEA
ncbi:endonuclease III [Lichenihabitans sp. PAMC28606]|nr:endonuclease III [Lichenihabitans sp. PAMC28606]UDL96683.1 endonuclease III [Lichenihabitans sp. PAMC28606]